MSSLLKGDEDGKATKDGSILRRDLSWRGQRRRYLFLLHKYVERRNGEFSTGFIKRLDGFPDEFIHIGTKYIKLEGAK